MNFLEKYFPQTGKNPHGEHKKKIQQSQQYNNNSFVNREKENLDMSFKKIIGMIKSSMKKKNSRPKSPIETIPFSFTKNARENSFYWFGHSTLLLSLGGTTVLCDPVFSKRVSPFQWLGPKKFDYTNDYEVEELPDIDIVLISHDHYDHLDYGTIQKLKKSNSIFVTSLGVGSHLKFWGIKKERIVELDWGEDYSIKGVTFTAAQALHFSGRLFTRNQTLRSSRIIKTKDISVYFGADSGYHGGFTEIAKDHGPFDMVFIESAAYSKFWNIHMKPKGFLKAVKDLKAKNVMPIHRGKFDLAFHGRNEPIRYLRKHITDSCSLMVPKIGEKVDLGKTYESADWWN